MLNFSQKSKLITGIYIFKSTSTQIKTVFDLNFKKRYYINSSPIPSEEGFASFAANNAKIEAKK